MPFEALPAIHSAARLLPWFIWNNRIVRARSPANVAAVILENAPGTHVLNNQDLASFTPTR
jgi:hypothetical protein